MSWFKKAVALFVLVGGVGLVSAAAAAPVVVAATTPTYCELAFSGSGIPYTIAGTEQCTSGSATTLGSTAYEAANGCVVYVSSATPIANPDQENCVDEASNLQAGGGIPPGIPAITPALLASITPSGTSSTSTSTKINNQDLPASTCSFAVNYLAVGGANIIPSSVSSSLGCSQPPTTTACAVYFINSPSGAATTEEIFTNTSCKAFASGGTGTLNGKKYTLVSYIEQPYATCAYTGPFGSLSGIPCAIGEMITDLGSGEIIAQVMGYAQGAMALPFDANGGITSWITNNNGKDLKPVYNYMAVIGMIVVVLAAVCRLLADTLDKKARAGAMLLGAPVRAVIAIAAINVFYPVFQWAVPEFTALAGTIYTQMASIGVPATSGSVFTSSGFQPAALVGLGGAEIAGLLAVIIALIMILYLFVLFILRSVILAFAMALAPIAIGLAVFDYRNQMFDLWLKLFVGALLMSIAGAIGVGVTFDIANIVLSTATNPLDWVMGMVVLIGGLYLTTKLMNVVMRGSMSHRSPTGLLMGMEAGAIGAMALGQLRSTGSGVAAKGAAAGTAATAGKLTAKGAALKDRTVAGAQRLQGKRPAADTASMGALGAASLATRTAVTGDPTIPKGAVDTMLAQDEQSQEVIATATAHMDPSTGWAARVAFMAKSPQHQAVLRQLQENGTGVSQLLGGTHPTRVRFNYTKDEMDQMNSTAAQAARSAPAMPRMPQEAQPDAWKPRGEE